uniref:NfeD family protein n=1 Tax=Pedobacter schmidteae TaxID=2201271 RepID=UPI000EB59D74|nr:NfeD family protein [Pedobacter schmidteae]
MDYFNTLEPLLRAFWFIAIPVSLIFIVQTVMTFLGVDSADGIDADFDGNLDHADAPFQLFSFRNLINFLLGLSWTGISFYQLISNRPLLIILSVAVGIGFVLLFFVIIRQIQKLAEDNTFKIEKALHKSGSVYLRIPAQRSGSGKIQVSVNGSFKEIEAITEQESIESGASIRIIKIENPNLVVVEKI